MKVAIIGTRNAENFHLQRMLEHIPEECSAIISGGAEGIDMLAAACAAARGVMLQVIPPDYSRYGKRAPLIRNAEIVGCADLVLAFWDFASRGTASALSQCVLQGKNFRIIALESLKMPDLP